jgi:hypothetical protein
VAVAVIFLRKFAAIAAASLLAVFFAEVGASAHGGGGMHGSFAPAVGHGPYGGYGRGFDGRAFRHDFHSSHRDNAGHHFAGHDFGPWDGRGSHGGFGRWQPGHWHLASGFGGGAHWHEDGVWHR